MTAPSFAALFEAQVERTPEAIALITGSLTWSYAALNARANRLAHALRARGVGPGSIVAVALPRSDKMVVNELAVLKAGGAFLPIDPHYPAQRIRYMLSDARPAFVLTDSSTAKHLPDGIDALAPMLVLDTDESQDMLRRQPDRNPAPAHTSASASLADAAYLIYTSGSTGRPKGVIVTHQGVANMAEAFVKQLEVTPDARVAQLASPSFDASIMEMLMAFGAGATLVVPLREVMVGEILAEVLVDLEITHALIPPATLATIPEAEHGFAQLKVLAVGGEACSPELVARWAPGRRMINAYGPTEATICTTMSTPLEAGGRITIGRPITNAMVMVLDAKLRPCPVGVPGELYIAGVGLARGYLNRPGLTADRFVANPYGTPGSRMYRTGDVVRWRQDKTLEFMGRADDQVKLRGFRIELGEIESVLAAQPGVASAVVALREDRPGDKRLIGYLVVRPGNAIDTAAMRTAAAQQLPEHMVPAGLMLIDALPLTPNGKLDRAALPMPDPAALAPTRAARAPTTATEERLCHLCAQVLGHASVDDADANFFEIGGHSMLAIQLGRRIRDEIRGDFPIAGVYTTPVLSELAKLLDGSAPLSEVLDLDRDSQLPARITGHASGLDLGHSTPMQRVFLTGATGYVGSYLLASLLNETRATIVCHVRATTPAEGRQRLLAALKAQRLDAAYSAPRIEIVLGDLGQPRLGLDEAGVHTVRDTCDSIIHCGAKVDFLHPYASLKAANVDAVITLLEWTTQGCAKRMHHVSTLGIVDTTQIRGTINEATPLDAWRGLVGGYNQSKWVADALATQAQAAGVPVSIYRLGSVTGDHTHALCNPADFIWRMARLCADLEAIPDMDLALNMTPVCDVARAIVRLGGVARGPGQIYHLLSGHELTLHDLGPVLQELGLNPRYVGIDEWAAIARDKLHADADNNLLALLAILSKYDRAAQRPHIVGDTTRAALEGVGAPIARVSRALLRRYLKNLGVQGSNVIAS